MQQLRSVQLVGGGVRGVPDHVEELADQPGQHGRPARLSAGAADTFAGENLTDNFYYEASQL